MDISQVTQPLNKFIQQMSSTVKVDHIYIFGSHLEGNATKDSDIDVIVVSDDFQKMDPDQRLDVLYDAAENIEPDVHPWGFTNKEVEAADEFTTLWYASTSGIRFL